MDFMAKTRFISGLRRPAVLDGLRRSGVLLKHILPIAAGHFRPWKGGNG
jgi:hypothetical protein